MDDTKYQEFVKKAFEAAELPEVKEKDLETGTYTNAQIAEMMKGDPMQLLLLLMQVQKISGQAEKRSILSFAVDMATPIKQ